MKHALLHLPQAQTDALARNYSRAVSARRQVIAISLVVLVFLIALAGYYGEVNIAKFAANIGNFTSYFYRIIPQLRLEFLWTDLAEWMWGLDKWGSLLLDTILIAYVGTILGAIGGFALCFLASENLIASYAVRWAARRFLEFCRTVPSLVFGLLMVLTFGLGPMAGVIAIMIHVIGALGKQFAEVVDNIDMNPVDGLRASGATWVEMVRFAVLPQVLPSFASYGLLRFEINVREASVMGFVGAGGIGQDFLEAIRKFYYSDVSAMLVLIVITVFVIDIATGALRHRLIGAERNR